MLRSAIIGSLAILGAAGCGSAHGSHTGSAPPAATPNQASAGFQGQARFADTGPQGSVITFIVKPGADPQAVGHRIAGPNAKVVPALQTERPNQPSAVALDHTFVVSVEPGQEQDALHRAQSDPDVQQAYLAKNFGG